MCSDIHPSRRTWVTSIWWVVAMVGWLLYLLLLLLLPLPLLLVALSLSSWLCLL